MIDAKNEREFVYYIKLLSNQFVDDYTEEKDQQQLLDKIEFCVSELIFWKERGNELRYLQSLKDLLHWLLDKIEKKF